MGKDKPGEGFIEKSTRSNEGEPNKKGKPRVFDKRKSPEAAEGYDMQCSEIDPGLGKEPSRHEANEKGK